MSEFATTKLRLALDWTPNANHAGFYLALKNGWYASAGIDLDIQPPSAEYTSDETPARRVVNGSAEFCIAPSESVISSWTSEAGKARPVCVAAILQNGTSAIVSLASSGITSAAQLDGKKYASYGGRFEMNIIQQMIKNAGGKGETIEVVPPKLQCFDEVLNGNCDATWIFMGWEGVQVRSKVDLNVMSLTDCGVPYGRAYSPCLIAHPDFLTEKQDILRRFLEVTSRGYIAASQNPAEAAAALLEVSQHSTLKVLGADFLVEAQTYLAEGNHILNAEGKWGVMEASRWVDWLNWLTDNKLLTARDGSVIAKDAVNVTDLFTNSFLP